MLTAKAQLSFLKLLQQLEKLNLSIIKKNINKTYLRESAKSTIVTT